MVKLQTLRKNDKFKWNGIVYTVYDSEAGMTEVFGLWRFWAWPSHAMVERVIHG